MHATTDCFTGLTLATPPVADALIVVKRCGCCHRSYTAREWRDLPLCGYQHVDADGDDPAMDIEERHCRCGSTIAIEVKP